MKSYFLLISTVFLISFSYILPQIFAEETLDFENCDGFLSVDELKSTIDFEGEVTVRSRPLMPTDDVSGLQTWCNSTFESSKGAISMSVIAFDSVVPAIAIYEKNLDEMRNGNYTINEYFTFWKNTQIDLNIEGLGSMVFSQYQKFFLSFHTTLTGNNETLVNVEDLRKLSSMVQKKILDLPEVTISPPNPILDNDVGPTTNDPPPKPVPPPIEEGNILSPKKQVAQGIAPEEVMCNEGLVLLIKYNGSPACVKHDTALILEERNWGGMPPPCCKPTEVSSITNFEECIAAGNPAMESYPRQCRTSDGKHFVESILEFSLSYTREGGIAGISQNTSFDTENNLIKISGFNSKTLGPISNEDTQSLWDVILENQFFELDSKVYPPVEGSADYFTYNLEVITLSQRNSISWTDTSSEFPKELVLITQEIDRQIQFYS